jgi:hypothetical protein
MANETRRRARSAFEFTSRTLVNAVRGVSRSVEPAPALRELIRRSAASRSLLSEVVADEAKSADVRGAAAVALGREPHPETEQALIEALATEDSSVVRRAAEAIGKIGSEAALGALARVNATDMPARRTVEFARALIEARFGLGTYRFADRPHGREVAVDRSTAERLLPSAVPAKDKRAVLAAAEKDLPGLPLANESLVALDCGRFFVLALTRQLREAETLDILTDASAVLAVLFERAPTGDYYFLSEYLLAQPGPEKLAAEVSGVRQNGTFIHFGELQPASGAFRLRTVDPRASLPIDIHGLYDVATGNLRFDEILVQKDFRAPQMEPTPE